MVPRAAVCGCIRAVPLLRAGSQVRSVLRRGGGMVARRPRALRRVKRPFPRAGVDPVAGRDPGPGTGSPQGDARTARRPDTKGEVPPVHRRPAVVGPPPVLHRPRHPGHRRYPDLRRLRQRRRLGEPPRDLQTGRRPPPDRGGGGAARYLQQDGATLGGNPVYDWAALRKRGGTTGGRAGSPGPANSTTSSGSTTSGRSPTTTRSRRAIRRRSTGPGSTGREPAFSRRSSESTPALPSSPKTWGGRTPPPSRPSSTGSTSQG